MGLTRISKRLFTVGFGFLFFVFKGALASPPASPSACQTLLHTGLELRVVNLPSGAAVTFQSENASGSSTGLAPHIMTTVPLTLVFHGFQIALTQVIAPQPFENPQNQTANRLEHRDPLVLLSGLGLRDRLSKSGGLVITPTIPPLLANQFALHFENQAFDGLFRIQFRNASWNEVEGIELSQQGMMSLVRALHLNRPGIAILDGDDAANEMMLKSSLYALLAQLHLVETSEDRNLWDFKLTRTRAQTAFASINKSDNKSDVVSAPGAGAGREVTDEESPAAASWAWLKVHHEREEFKAVAIAFAESSLRRLQAEMDSYPKENGRTLPWVQRYAAFAAEFTRADSKLSLARIEASMGHKRALFLEVGRRAAFFAYGIANLPSTKAGARAQQEARDAYLAAYETLRSMMEPAADRSRVIL